MKPPEQCATWPHPVDLPHRANHDPGRPSTIASFRLIQAASLLVGVSGLEKGKVKRQREAERQREQGGWQHDGQNAVSGR